MRRLAFFPFAILLFIQFSLYILLSSSSLAQEWTVRGKQQGTLRVVDLFQPDISTLWSYAEGLVMVDKDNKTVPGLAVDWRWINNKTIEFRLREAVRFHNGERFNAEAVRVNWEEYRKMDTCPGIRASSTSSTILSFLWEGGERQIWACTSSRGGATDRWRWPSWGCS